MPHVSRAATRRSSPDVGGRAAATALGAGRAQDELADYPLPRSKRAGSTTNSIVPATSSPGCPGAVHGIAHGRHRPGRVRRQGAVDAASRACRSRNLVKKPKHADPLPKPDGVLTFDRLSLGVHFQHQSGRPARAPDAQECRGAGQHKLKLYDGPEAAIARRASMNSSVAPDQRNCRSTQNCVHCKTCDIKTRRRTSNGWCRKAAAAQNLPEHVVPQPTEDLPCQTGFRNCSRIAQTRCGA